MPSIHIKPNSGVDGRPHKIRLPGKPHEFLPEGGALVEKNKFWIRRLRDGSVVYVKQSMPAVESKAVKTTKKE